MGKIVAVDGDKALACAVIQRALDDLFRGEPGDWWIAPQTLEWEEAFDFFTKESGGWAESRRLWCSLAEIDAQAVREIVEARYDTCIKRGRVQ
jgi:hypothetical protein